VLSNPLTRSIYDQRGITGLNEDLHKGLVPHPLSGKGPFIEHFTFNENDKSHYTMGTAERLFEEASQKGLPEFEKDDNLLKAPEYLENLKKDLSKDQNVIVAGYVQETSKIVGEGGKTVEVTKTSKLSPEGNIITHAQETFFNEKGEKISKTFSNEINLMSEEAPKGIHN
jgi:hypothetical protein